MRAGKGLSWMFETVGMGLLGVCGGFMVSGGVFTALLVLGLVPRFAGKTRTAYKILTYESAAVYGCVIGGFLSALPVSMMISSGEIAPKIRDLLVGSGISLAVLIVGGFMAGCFVGCLALAIAEMLDSIPIFTRRVGFKEGIGITVLTMAVGKTFGSLVYFAFLVYESID